MTGPFSGEVLTALTRQAVGPVDGYETHVHPDLADRLQELGEGSVRDLTPALGLVALVRPVDRPFAIAVSMSTILLRLDVQPDDVIAAQLPDWFAVSGWIAVDAWQSGIPREEGTARLRRWVREAFDHA